MKIKRLGAQRTTSIKTTKVQTIFILILPWFIRRPISWLLQGARLLLLAQVISRRPMYHLVKRNEQVVIQITNDQSLLK